jgi:FdhE protein
VRSGLRPKFRRLYRPPTPSVNAGETVSRTSPPAQLPEEGLSPHNRPVSEIVWQQRIRRAETLAAQHPFAFARELLDFYVRTARFQQDLHRRLELGSAGISPPLGPIVRPGQRDVGATIPGLAGLPELLSRFPAYLTLVEERAPARLAQVAHDLSQLPSSWAGLLNSFWFAIDHPAAGQLREPSEFLALAFLQPYAEFIRSRVPLQLGGYTHALCPFCGRKPGVGVLRPLGDGARRNLLCGFCLCEWEFHRIVCPGCDEKDHVKLPVYTAEEFPHIRVECCDTCRTYLKSIDLSKNGLADPLVDELASVPLDLWAQERGYAKLHPNLLGM